MFAEIWKRLWEMYSPESIARWLSKVAPDFISAILIMGLFYLLWLVASRIIRSVERRVEVDATLFSFVKTMTKTILFLVGVISALSEVGINTGAFLTSLGVAGLTIGFAAKDALSNLISGLFILWDRPFVLGDLVEVDGNYGRVDTITLRSTRIVTIDGKMLAVPNAMVVNSKVASYTNFPHLRLDIDMTVDVDENLGNIRSLFLEHIEKQEGLLPSPPPTMVVTAINDYNIALQFRVWLDDEKRHIAVRFALRESLFELLREEGVAMPYETIAIDMKERSAA